MEIIPQKQVEFSLQQAGKALTKSIKIATILGLAVLVFCLTIMPIIYNWHWQISILTGLTIGPFFGMIVGITIVISNALTTDRATDMRTERTNQGIWNSLNNAFIVGILTMFTTLIFYVVCLLFLGEMDFTMFIVGFGFAIVTGIVAATSDINGNTFLKHFALRIVLDREMIIPKNYANFLDYASSLTLLNKVGGGYEFTNLWKDYFRKLQLPQNVTTKRNILWVLASYLR